ncbi:Alpha/Beta hydrolase protein [Aspergillus floccosus]
MTLPLIVLPRPGTASSTASPLPAPSEAAFTSTFGNLLPPASYLDTLYGHAAYYKLPPSYPPTPSSSSISRILFVHGVQTPAIGLHPLASALASRFPHAQCVLLDLWGHGLSETPVLPHELGLFHALIEALLTELGWDDAHFVGYSFGGSTTATFAAARPERVASMVLVAPAGLVRAAQFDAAQQKYLSLHSRSDEEEEKARAWVLQWLEDGELVVPDDWEERVARGEVVAEAVREWQMREHAGHLASVVGILRDGGVLDAHKGFVEAARTGIPSLCVLGETDGLCSVRDLEGVGMRNVKVVPGVGHGVVRERVEEVADFIEWFWRKL